MWDVQGWGTGCWAGVPAHGESGIHAAVKVKLTEKNQALAPLQIRLVIRWHLVTSYTQSVRIPSTALLNEITQGTLHKESSSILLEVPSALLLKPGSSPLCRLFSTGKGLTITACHHPQSLSDFLLPIRCFWPRSCVSSILAEKQQIRFPVGPGALLTCQAGDSLSNGKSISWSLIRRLDEGVWKKSWELLSWYQPCNYFLSQEFTPKDGRASWYQEAELGPERFGVLSKGDGLRDVNRISRCSVPLLELDFFCGENASCGTVQCHIWPLSLHL